MRLREIKTYEEMDAYCEKRGYENLTDKQIEALCAKVWQICNREEKEIRATEKRADYGIMSLMIARNQAVARCYRLRNCTEERILQNIRAEFDRANQYGTRNPSDTALMTEKEAGWERKLD